MQRQYQLVYLLVTEAHHLADQFCSARRIDHQPAVGHHVQHGGVVDLTAWQRLGRTGRDR